MTSCDDDIEQDNMMHLLGFSTFGSKPTKRMKRKRRLVGFSNFHDSNNSIHWLSSANQPTRSPTTYEKIMPPSNMALLNELKQQFSALSEHEFQTARTRANVYEVLGKGPFLNRSAMKLANLDNAFGFTNTTQDMTFADLCGGPGGFSEYLLIQRPDARGFGMTLKDTTSCDWNIGHLGEEKNTRLTCSYGDITKVPNIQAFADQVLSTYAHGVDLVVADGGFQSARNDPDQEQLMQTLIWGEISCMVHVLAQDGQFVLKCFEIQHPFTISLVFLLHQAFDRMTIVKPVTSRPASSERYIVCQNFQASGRDSYLDLLLRTHPQQQPLYGPSTMSQDRHFSHYLSLTNHRFVQLNIRACQDILDHSEKNQRNDPQHLGPARSIDVQAFYNQWGIESNNRIHSPQRKTSRK